VSKEAMQALTELEVRSSSFHIHVDAAVLPSSLEKYAKETYGFFDDDFEHRLVIEGFTTPLPARQLTQKIQDRLARKSVQAICEDLAERGRAEGLAGMIQSEFVMNETTLKGDITTFRPAPFPFYVNMRRVNPDMGENFKSHELHLEIKQGSAASGLVTELARSGLNVSFGSGEITFTASGDLNHIRKVQMGLLHYLRTTGGLGEAKLTIEATVFFSLHKIRAEDTPMVIESVEYIQ
jgi:hypothetical protein